MNEFDRTTFARAVNDGCPEPVVPHILCGSLSWNNPTQHIPTDSHSSPDVPMHVPRATPPACPRTCHTSVRLSITFALARTKRDTSTKPTTAARSRTPRTMRSILIAPTVMYHVRVQKTRNPPKIGSTVYPLRKIHLLLMHLSFRHFNH